ncbi:MAG: hydroxymethylbilane synthase, partial [Myxococcales bacterium]
GLLRGNVDTRLRRVREGTFDATLLAAAGIARLGVETGDLAVTELDPWSFVPAAGQGALGITALLEADVVRETLLSIHDELASIAVETERAVARALGGSCDLPLGVFARSHPDGMEAVAVVVSSDGGRLLRHEVRGPMSCAVELAAELAARLRAEGAMALLERRGS